MMRIVLVLPALCLLTASSAVAQGPSPALRDSLRTVLADLLAVSKLSPVESFYQSRPLLADSVSCIAGEAPCSGFQRDEILFSDTPLRMRLLVGQDQGWTFDWETLQVIASAPGLAVALIRWGTEPTDTTVALRCDSRQSAKSMKTGLWTVVFQHGPDKLWKVKHAHESSTAMTRYAGCPRNREILFDSDRTGRLEVHALDPATLSVRQITRTPGDSARSGNASWSPDGRQLAFARTANHNADIYVVNADGSSPRRLTHDPADDVFPSWSADGEYIAFVSARDGNREIYVMRSDGSDERNLTSHPAFDNRPVWSPIGGQILFLSDRDHRGDRPRPNLYVMSADGSNVRRLTDHTRADMTARWSPDGQQIVFASNRDGNQEVYAMAVDGSNVRRLTDQMRADGGPAWSPDGQWIVFHSERDGNSEIYMIRVDGSGLVRLTANAAFDGHPAW